MRKNIG